MSNTAVDRIQQLKTVQDEAVQLFEKKNHDYGDAFADYNVVGVLVRLGDKVKRCQSISKKGIQLVEGEKLRDTLIDMHNYAAMAIMLMDEKNGSRETEDMDKYSKNKGYVLLDKWEIEGDSEKKYIRETYRCLSSKTHIETCTCPSYMYGGKKTCKHIQHPENYKPTKILVNKLD